MSLMAERYLTKPRKIERKRHKTKNKTSVLHLEYCGDGFRIVDLTYDACLIRPCIVIEVDDWGKMHNEFFFAEVVSKLKTYSRNRGYNKISLANRKNYLWMDKLN